MPEGLTNAPAAFQRFMNDIFADMIDVNVIVYLDDILVYSDDLTEHKQHVREVLWRLHTNGLFTHADKYKFHVTSCEYLGYMLSPDSLMMAQNKVQIIQDWPELHKVKDIQSFLGFSNFYHRFIYEYSRIVVPLTNLTCKNVPWNFTDECRSAFNTLKKAFTTTLVLTHWIPDTQITVETDTSDYALTVILSIMTPSGELHPIAFHSQTFKTPERNYTVHNKELLAIVEAFTCWRHYLEGKRFIYEYSRIVVPLTHLTCKNVPWNFTDECRSAFNTLKKAFTTTLVLTHWIPDTQITVETDASDYALTVILSITTPSGGLHPIAFHSQTFSSPECNYDVHDKELLTIVEAFTHWRHYLEGSSTPINVITDHQNLQYFSTTKILTRRQACWSEFLSAFNLVIRSIPENWEPNPMLLLDDGMSTLKRGIATMPLSIHRTTDLCSLPNSWHHPFELLPLLFPSYEDH